MPTWGGQAHCPNCEEETNIHIGKPWLGGVCLECGATV